MAISIGWVNCSGVVVVIVVVIALVIALVITMIGLVKNTATAWGFWSGCIGAEIDMGLGHWAHLAKIMVMVGVITMTVLG